MASAFIFAVCPTFTPLPFLPARHADAYHSFSLWRLLRRITASSGFTFFPFNPFAYPLISLLAQNDHSLRKRINNWLQITRSLSAKLFFYFSLENYSLQNLLIQFTLFSLP